jgi:hypothetical protein
LTPQVSAYPGFLDLLGVVVFAPTRGSAGFHRRRDTGVIPRRTEVAIMEEAVVAIMAVAEGLHGIVRAWIAMGPTEEAVCWGPAATGPEAITASVLIAKGPTVKAA